MGLRVLRAAHVLLLAVACFVVYSNSYHHAYHLDDGHLLLENPAVRSLKNIPLYFSDPGTFTSLRANVDYRPVLVITYALDHWLGGYEMWWWHLTQILLHVSCVCFLYALCLRVLQRSEPAVLGAKAAWIAFAAAVVFAVHPTASGVVNYQSARSSLLTATFLLPALLAYMRPASDEAYRKTMWATAVLFGLALFTKVEAVGCLAVFFLYDCWQTSRRGVHASGFVADVLRTLNLTTLKRLWPALVICAAYFVIRIQVMADYPFDKSSRRADVTHLDYLLTQLVACWYYVRHWFAPVGLVADHGSFSVYRSLLDGHVLLALGSWMLAGSWLAAQWKTRPQMLFLALSALALISPTSSFMPLAEMVNEHRPYLPVAVLSLTWMILLGMIVADSVPSRRFLTGTYCLAFLAITMGLGGMTFQRNKVFQTQEAYWQDVVAKAPCSRAYVNYGLIFMARADYDKALEYFNTALKEAPNWHIAHVNLAVALDALGQSESALEHYNRAVDCDTFSWTALTWRAMYFLKHGKHEQARADFEASSKKSLDRYTNYKGLATSWAGLGNAEKCFEYTNLCLGIDSQKVEVDIKDILNPFFADPSAQNAAHQYGVGLEYLDLVNARLPDRWWVYCNKSELARRLGRQQEAQEWQDRCNELKLLD